MSESEHPAPGVGEAPAAVERWDGAQDQPPSPAARLPVRAEAVAGLGTALVVVLAGVAVAAIWYALAPRVVYQITSPGRAGVVDAETKGFVAADGYFFFVTVAAGLLLGVLGFVFLRRYSIGTLLGLAAGGAAAAVIAWKLGVAFTSGHFHDLLRSRPTGTRIDGPLGLRATGVIVAWPIASLVAYFVATAYATADAAAVAGRARRGGRSPGD